MTVHIHALHGCGPTPLARYLKALGIFRIVAEQVDEDARAYWRDGIFRVATSLDLEQLIDFFLFRYAPSPLVAPWNGGSGFYPKDNRMAIDAIASGGALRMASYREGIDLSRLAVGNRRERPADEEKRALIAACRAGWPAASLRWLDAALVLGDDDVRYPALLGTGGNDGRLDFTNNQMQRLVELLDPDSGAPRPGARSLLESALLRHLVSHLGNKAIGQFDPGGAGGANLTSSYEGNSLLNPWDFVLALEGALQLRVAATRRLDGRGLAQAAAPFAVRARSAGYGSAAGAADESARGEQWMPLWPGPATLPEVSRLFGEARFQSDRSRAESALDAAIAIARIGLARGVTAFVRYGFIERNGQANLAVPLGVWRVADKPVPEAVDRIAEWLDLVRRAAGAEGAAAQLGRGVRTAETALMNVLRHRTPERWQSLLIELGRVEALLVARPKSTGAAKFLGPIPPLDVRIADLADDGSPEVRLALAFASMRGSKRAGPVRRHLVPLDPGSGWRDFARSSETLQTDPEVCWTGADFVADACRVVSRRLLLSAKDAGDDVLIDGARPARLDDIALFVRGAVDERRIGALAPALMAIEWADPRVDRRLEYLPRAPEEPVMDALWACARAVYLPRRLVSSDLRVGLALGPFRRLAGGMLRSGIVAALGRLGAMGVRAAIDPRIHHIDGTPSYARRLAASLAFPLSRSDAHFVMNAIERTSRQVQRS